MSVTGSPDWYLASIDSCKKTHRRTLFPTCKSLHFFSVPCSNYRFHLNSSSCPSPILEEPSIDSRNSIESEQLLRDFEQAQLPDNDNLNDFLSGLFRDTQNDAFAFEYYQKAKERAGFRPEKSMLNDLIRYLVRLKKWDLILLVSDDFNSFNVLPDGYACANLVSSCIRARKFKIVEGLIGIFENDSVVAELVFSAVMRGYNKLHMFSSTTVVYERMKSDGVVPNSGCYFYTMEAYNKIRNAERVIELFQEFQSRELDSGSFSSNIYRVLCESLGKLGRANEALGFFREMKRNGVMVDSSIYSSLICSFSSIREVKIAEELFKEAEGEKKLRDPAMFLNLVLMYVEEGLLESTLEVVKVMQGAKLRVSDCIFCAIVNGYSRRRGFSAAARVYETLISQGCQPGQVTYASILNIYCRLGLYSKAEMIFTQMEGKGFIKCVVAYSSMIVMYGKTGRLREATRLLAKMKERGCEPNVWIYNSLMEMHGKVKNLRQVEKLWKEMKRRKVVPDKVSYTSVINAYNKVKDFEACMRYYNEYRINGGMIDRAMAGIMVGIFSKISRVDELVKLLRDMKLEETPLDKRLYGSALHALRDAGLQMQAKWFEQNFEAT